MAVTLPSLNVKEPSPHPSDAPPAPDTAVPARKEHSTLAGKVLQVFRVGGDNEHSVGRHSKPPAEPEARRTGPVQQQLITDASGPVVARTLEDSLPVAIATAPLPDIVLGQNQSKLAPAAAAVASEPIRLQTFSIDLAERLARTRAAQQEVMRELDGFDASGDALGKRVTRKP